MEEKGDFALEKKAGYVGITRAKKKLICLFAMKRAYHGDWMDALPSRFINEIPDESVEKNEINTTDDENFDFNQDDLLSLKKSIEVQAGIGIKKTKCLNGKNK